MPRAATHSTSRILVASVAGGPACQYRVQIVPHGQTTWRLFSTFKQREVATECAQQLAAEGMHARVISVRICPTAA